MSEPAKKKVKKSKDAEPAAEAEADASGSVMKSYEERLTAVGPISQPMADKKMTKKLHKLVKKASAAKMMRRGVKEVVKGLRKNVTGICILAGDISPIDVISHVPIFCEEKKVRLASAIAPIASDPAKEEGQSLNLRPPLLLPPPYTPQVTYIYVPSKQDLGLAASTKRPTSCVLITPKDGFESQDLYDEMLDDAKAAMPSEF